MVTETWASFAVQCINNVCSQIFPFQYLFSNMPFPIHILQWLILHQGSPILSIAFNNSLQSPIASNTFFNIYPKGSRDIQNEHRATALILVRLLHKYALITFMVLRPIQDWHVISLKTKHPRNNNNVSITAACGSFTKNIVCKKQASMIFKQCKPQEVQLLEVILSNSWNNSIQNKVLPRICFCCSLGFSLFLGVSNGLLFGDFP